MVGGGKAGGCGSGNGELNSGKFGGLGLDNGTNADDCGMRVEGRNQPTVGGGCGSYDGELGDDGSGDYSDDDTVARGWKGRSYRWHKSSNVYNLFAAWIHRSQMGTQAEAFLTSCADRIINLLEEHAVMILGVKDDLKKLQAKVELIKAVLEDAERKKLQYRTIEIWLNSLKDVLYEADDIIDLCRTKGRELLEEQPSSSIQQRKMHCSLLSFFSTVQLRHKIGSKIRKLSDRLTDIENNRLVLSLCHLKPCEQQDTTVNVRETSPLIDLDIVGTEIEDSTRKIVDMIFSHEDNFKIVAVTGMGGIGKTTLAQRVYNHVKIKNFYPTIIWICVSRKFSEVELIQEIIRQARGDNGHAKTKAELLPIMANTVANKCLFLVLDDIWSADVWNALLCTPLHSTPRCGCVLVTTRHQDVARGIKAMYIHEVQKLHTRSSLELLCKKARVSREDDIERLVKVGEEIVRKCDGLPLAIKLIGSLLARKGHNPQQWSDVLRSGIWNMKELPGELKGAWGALYMSYEDLPPHLKQCFLSLSLFPADYDLAIWDLRALWVAEGFLHPKEQLIAEELAENCYAELVSRSLLQPIVLYADQRKCRMHDLLRSLAQYLSRGESLCGDPRKLDAFSLSKIRRLSVLMDEEVEEEADPLTRSQRKNLSLRTLMLLEGTSIFQRETIFSFPCLRVLVLNGKAIENLPSSIENLLHLRMLNLNYTSIASLPMSIGSLKNLQILYLIRCLRLHSLPASITQLDDLRCLGLNGTPVTHVPKGLGKLKLLNDIGGFVAGGHTTCQTELQEGWGLEELESLAQLRWLSITRLERAMISKPMLKSKCFLRHLILSCTMPQYKKLSFEEINTIEAIFEGLFPPPSLEKLQIINFCGQSLPGWLISSSLETNLPCIEYIHLIGCSFCTQLPPFGKLPQLRYLNIEDAFAIVNIGTEFVGMHGVSTAFPKLEYLTFNGMPNWEEWSMSGNEEEEEPLMPHLVELQILDLGQEEDPYDYYYEDPDNLENP
ncbi:putative disease resistance protein RGA3 [Oryza glaberrima]|uniref:putative disease resistance protein RGA3 n=1 Tax=Oryza glaberrima TaxID=4538 RepID=UPI00224C00EB|nr:putative disease resistance protein RGA3 [Oryza glaberrima]